jgi:hypothetical protein
MYVSLVQHNMQHLSWYSESFEKYRLGTGFDPVSQDAGLTKGVPLVFINNQNPSSRNKGWGVRATVNSTYILYILLFKQLIVLLKYTQTFWVLRFFNTKLCIFDTLLHFVIPFLRIFMSVILIHVLDM